MNSDDGLELKQGQNTQARGKRLALKPTNDSVMRPFRASDKAFVRYLWKSCTGRQPKKAVFARLQAHAWTDAYLEREKAQGIRVFELAKLVGVRRQRTNDRRCARRLKYVTKNDHYEQYLCDDD